SVWPDMGSASVPPGGHSQWAALPVPSQSRISAVSPDGSVIARSSVRERRGLHHDLYAGRAALMPIWLPDTTAIEGWMIEVPVRAPKLLFDLWVHWSGLAADWAGFPPVLTDGDWHRTTGILAAPVPD